MKKLSSKITAVLFAACISLNTLASTITVNWDGTGDTSGFGSPEDWALSVVIKPETLTIYDSIEIISTGVRGSGPVTVENTVFQIDEAALTLDIFLNVGFLTVVSPWHYTENIGTLPAGVYDLTVTAYADYGPPETCFTSLNVVVAEPTITVNWDGTGDYLTIQDAIDAAVYGDTINVKAGTYIENVTLKNGVALVGEGADECIIDGNSNGPVIYSSRCNSQTTLTRFTITNGSGHINQYGRSLGGGMYNAHSDPTISYCVFTGNSVEYGGGIYNDNRSNPEISHCIFKNNIAEWWGAGIVNYHYCNPIVFNCSFIENDARYGGGIYNYNFCNAEIINCVFKENLATSKIYFSCGGGIFNDKESNSFISNCLFIDNTVSDAGGGVYNRSSSPTVISCTFNGNWADIYGGAIGNYNASNPRVANCILWKNRAKHEGNEVYNLESSGSEPCSPIFSHCNISNSGGSGINWDVLIGIDGGGNIDTNPLFVNPAEKDFRLMFDSPCIDTGDPDSEYQPGATDLDGNPRVINGIVDMGAYEFIHPVKVSVDIKPQTCPNPVNVKSKGILPVAILGSDVLDVNDIDLDTILLEGVAPLRGSYEDVASPVIDGTECACTLEGADGYVDLSLKFDSQAILSALGEVADNEVWMLYLTGYLKDGTPIEGADCIIIKKKGKKLS